MKIIIITILCLFISLPTLALESMTDTDLMTVTGQLASAGSTTATLVMPVQIAAPVVTETQAVVSDVNEMTLKPGIAIVNQYVNIKAMSHTVKMVQTVKQASFFGLFF